MRSITRSVYVSSSFVPKRTSRTTVTAEAMSAVRRAHQKLETSIALSVIAEAASSMTASSTRTIRKPRTSVSGSLIAATSGRMAAFRIAMTRETMSAPTNVLISTSGTIHAAMKSAAADTSHDRKSRAGLIFGRTSRCSIGVGGGALTGLLPVGGVVATNTYALHASRARAAACSPG